MDKSGKLEVNHDSTIETAMFVDVKGNCSIIGYNPIRLLAE